MVSVNDIKEVDELPKDILKAIFDKQNELLIKYADIEGMNGIEKSLKENIDTKSGQLWLKDFIYRAIEEIGESFEVVANTSWESLNDLDKIHYSEELIDALHFMIELMILSGYESKDFKKIEDYGNQSLPDESLSYEAFMERHFNIIYLLTLAGNKLRNKKWKQTNVLTDRNIYKFYLESAFNKLIYALKAVGNNDEDIYNLYFKKNKVNQFRQRSGY